MFKKKVVFGLMFITLLSAALVGCGAKDSTSEAKTVEELANCKVLNFNLGVDPNTLDPALNHSIDGSDIINNIYEGLTREIDGVLENAMAEKIDISEDGTVYTFHLRDAMWSDGETVKAGDFQYGWMRTLNPENAAPYAPHMFYIKNAKEYYDGKVGIEDVGIKTIDEMTFQVTLQTPTPYFLSLITRGAFMPGREDIIAGLGDGWAKKPDIAVSNGPFSLEKYSTADEIILVKNQNYWNKDSVLLDEIVCKMIVEASTALTAFESGDFDIITKIPEQDKTRLMAADDRFHILPMLGTYYMIFNVEKEPLNDVNIRKALALSIDRKLISESVKKSGEIPANGFNPKGLKDSTGKDFNETAGTYGINTDGGNIEEAKEYLAKAGFPNGEGFPTLTLLYNTSESHKAVCETIQEMWKKNLGINVELGKSRMGFFL
jgi:oligopeptide transport system substrate-binding protein